MVALLSGDADCASIEVLLRPFQLNDQTIDTSIRLDGIDLPSLQLAQLVGRSFEFPINPDPAAIDGSVYIDGAHHPVDVNSIRFEKSSDNSAVVVIKAMLVLEFEKLANYCNTPITLGVRIANCAVQC
jgi:hypothetical protein